MITCKRCGNDKPYSEFHKSPWTSTGLSSICKACHLEASLVHQNKKVRVDPGTDREGMKRCKTCGKVKEIDQYYSNPAFEDDRNPSCIPCHLEACKSPQKLKARYCVMCGAEYIPKAKNQKYCSVKCR